MLKAAPPLGEAWKGWRVRSLRADDNGNLVFREAFIADYDANSRRFQVEYDGGVCKWEAAVADNFELVREMSKGGLSDRQTALRELTQDKFLADSNYELRSFCEAVLGPPLSTWEPSKRARVRDVPVSGPGLAWASPGSGAFPWLSCVSGSGPGSGDAYSGAAKATRPVDQNELNSLRHSLLDSRKGAVSLAADHLAVHSGETLNALAHGSHGSRLASALPEDVASDLSVLVNDVLRAWSQGGAEAAERCQSSFTSVFRASLRARKKSARLKNSAHVKKAAVESDNPSLSSSDSELSSSEEEEEAEEEDKYERGGGGASSATSRSAKLASGSGDLQRGPLVAVREEAHRLLVTLRRRQPGKWRLRSAAELEGACAGAVTCAAALQMLHPTADARVWADLEALADCCQLAVSHLSELLARDARRVASAPSARDRGVRGFVLVDLVGEADEAGSLALVVERLLALVVLFPRLLAHFRASDTARDRVSVLRVLEAIDGSLAALARALLLGLAAHYATTSATAAAEADRVLAAALRPRVPPEIRKRFALSLLPGQGSAPGTAAAAAAAEALHDELYFKATQLAQTAVGRHDELDMRPPVAGAGAGADAGSGRKRSRLEAFSAADKVQLARHLKCCDTDWPALLRSCAVASLVSGVADPSGRDAKATRERAGEAAAPKPVPTQALPSQRVPPEASAARPAAATAFSGIRNLTGADRGTAAASPRSLKSLPPGTPGRVGVQSAGAAPRSAPPGPKAWQDPQRKALAGINNEGGTGVAAATAKRGLLLVLDTSELAGDENQMRVVSIPSSGDWIGVGRAIQNALRFAGEKKDEQLLCISREHARLRMVPSSRYPLCELEVLSSNGVNVRASSNGVTVRGADKYYRGALVTLKPGDIVNFCLKEGPRSFSYRVDLEAD
jgi:hypothetical protein